MFIASQDCMACHNSLISPGGEDVSIGSAWRASIMANAARDPYWQASVRRETIDHPLRADDIQDECAICHMPMARAEARAQGRRGEVFAHLPIGSGTTEQDHLAADGVSCSLCHQITSDRFGTRESFVGGFVINRPEARMPRSMFGPFNVDDGHARVMQSVTGVRPTESVHVQQSELCATCHTLITQAFGTDGQVVGSIPEQVPYQEWQHSDFREKQSCQACHMPLVDAPTKIASVAGKTREGLRRHTFIGGNFFMQRMLNRYRTDLGVVASSEELDASANRTVRQLASESATIAIEPATVRDGTVSFNVDVHNLTGHKLPTGYPSRRAWLHVIVRDGSGKAIFESGATRRDGSIEGNDNDEDRTRFEPHRAEIRRPEDVQIYESILGGVTGGVTTGLLQATQFLKDNRLLPDGFDKGTADADIAVHGGASSDGDFTGGGDRVRYVVDVRGAPGPFAIEAELRYQPIGFRWAENLRYYASPEPKRFASYYDAMAAGSSTVLATAVSHAGR